MAAASRQHLVALQDKLVDLLPVMQHHVYHPRFKGSFQASSTPASSATSRS